MRGVAALAVVAYHAGLITQRELVPAGYLAVDFFFVLSGFVIDRAYSGRLDKGLGAGRFMVLRLYRLYPVFLVGALLGLIRFGLKLQAHALDLSPVAASVAAAANLLMLPVPFAYAVAFPLNNPAWSLFAEMAVNAVFAAGLWRAPRVVLAAVIVAGAIGMIIGVANPPFALNLGWRYDTLVFGLARVAFGFPLGMLVARWVDTHSADAAPTHVALPVGLLLAGLLLPVPHAWRGVFDLAFAFIGAPLIVVLGARVKLMPRLNPPLYALGILSYPLYAVHFPLLQFVHAAGAHNLPPLVVEAVMIAVAVAAAVAAERLVDLPARRSGSAYLTRATAVPNRMAIGGEFR